MNRFEDHRNLVLLLMLLALSTIIDGLDASIVNVALPTISNEMKVSISDTSWITLTYVIALASLLLPAARLANNGTVKKLFIIGVVVFTISSALCGISSAFMELVIFRLVQGIGAALMTAAVPVMIVKFIPSDSKGLGMGVLAVASGVAVVLGPSVGGILTSALSWNWIFIINIPFGIIAVLLALKLLPTDEGYDRAKNPDLLNSILTVFGIGWGLTFVQNIMGSVLSQSIIILCGALSAAFLGFMAYRMHRHPEIALVAPSMLKRRDFQLLCIAFTMTCMVIMGAQYVLPYHLQINGQFSTSESGYLLSVASIFAILLSVPVGKWCDKNGCKLPSVLAGVARLMFCSIFLIVSPKDQLPLLILGLATMGCSMAFAGTGLATAIIHHSDLENQADAATFLLEVNYVAASLGVALFALIFQTFTGSSHAELVTMDAVESGFDSAMIAGCLLSIVAIICALLVKNIVPEHSN